MATNAQIVQQLYIAYFGRPADPAGAENALKLVNWAGNPSALLADFGKSAEYTSQFTGLTAAQIVNKIYSNLFGRGAEADGLQFWSAKVDSGEIKLADATWTILSGVTAGSGDSVAIDSKVSFAEAFTAKLAATPAAAVAYNSSTLDLVKAEMAKVTSAATLATANTGLDAFVSSVTTNGSNSGGSTFTLTTVTDNITGTSGNDTIIGDFGVTGQVTAGDQIAGGAGTDTLKLYGTLGTLPVAISGVETINFVNPGDTAIDVSAIAGVTTLKVDQVLTTGAGRIYTTGAGTTLDVATNGGAVLANTLTWAGAATDTTQNLVLNGFQGVAGGTEAAMTITGAAATTLNITSQGTTPVGSTAANQISTLTTAATTSKVNVTATSALEVNTSLTGAAIAEVNASASTAGVTMNVNGTAGNLKVTGGKGNDTFIFGANNTFTTLDTVDGGDGSDTLGMRTNEAANTSTAFTNIKNFETLRVSGSTTAADTFNLAHFGVQNIRFDDTATATTNVTNIASGATLTLGTVGGGVALVIKDNGTADSLTIAARGGAGTYTVDASQFEKLTLNTSAITGAAIFALTDAQMQEVTLVNTTAAGTNPDFAVNLGTLGVVTNKVDVSAFKAATATNGVTLALSATAVNGATVTGSANNDNITGSSQADTITAGEGADTITGGAGNDTIILTETTAAIDNVILSAAATNGVDTIKGFDVGTTGVDTITFVAADTTAGTTSAAGVLGASTAALVVGGGNYTTTSSTTTSDVIEITTALDSTVTLSATSTGADLLQALSSDTTAAGGITATTANDKLFFLVYQNGNAYMFHGDANGGGAGGTSLIEAAEIRLVGVIEGVAAGAFVSGDILASA